MRDFLRSAEVEFFRTQNRVAEPDGGGGGNRTRVHEA